MTIVFSSIFIVSLAAGWGWAYLHAMDFFGYAVSMVIGGFIGSSIIALLFSWLYFFQKETDQEKIDRLQGEINRLKGVKQLDR